MRRSFPLQLFVLTILPLTALLLAIAFGSVTLHQRAMRSMVGERDERATRAAATAITEQLNHRQAAIRSLALQAAAANDPQHALADAAFLAPDFEGGMALFASNGVLLAATNDAEIWQAWITASSSDAVSGANDSPETQLIFPFADPRSGEEVMLVKATAGEFTAVGAFSPAGLVRNALNNIFSTIHNQAVAFVVAANGQVLYQTGTLFWSDSELPAHPGVVGALRGESGATYLPVGGDEHVIAFSPIAPVGWALVIEEPWRAVADPLLQTTEMAPLIFIPVLLIALIALWFGLRQIVQPLQSLERKATALGWGDFAAIEEPVGGIHEIQRLQTELIHMAQKVRRAQQSLRGYLGAVTAGQEEERRRLARDLHDDTIQSLIALNQQIQLAQLAPDEQTTAKLSRMQQMAEQIIADLRRLTRDLRPIYLEDLGLVPALDMLARDTGKMLHIPVTFTTTGAERRLRPEVELALYRIAQEGLSNIARHAQATGATVQLCFDEDQVTLAVEDDGTGFAVPESPAEMVATGHFGLLSLQERAELIGARLSVQSAQGTGTKVTVEAPAVLPLTDV